MLNRSRNIYKRLLNIFRIKFTDMIEEGNQIINQAFAVL